LNVSFAPSDDRLCGSLGYGDFHGGQELLYEAAPRYIKALKRERAAKQ
jgi:hypothetical protein